MKVFVDTQITLFQRQLTIRNVEDELKFNEAVLADNIDLAAQLEYRKAQLKRSKGDKTETQRLRSEVAHLKDRIEQRTFSDEYLEQLTGLDSGIEGIDNVITWLEGKLASSTDLEVKRQTQEALREQKGKRFTIQKQVIENETQFAIIDKSDKVIGDQLDKVRSARVTADLAGDTLLTSLYDLQVQALEKAQTENSVERSLSSFAVRTLTGGMNALQLLDEHNNEVNSAPDSGNIKVGGSLFGSAAEYWRYKRGSYLTDTGGAGFFSRFNNEKSQALGLLNANNQLNVQGIKNVQAEFEGLKTRAELQGFTFQIEVGKQESTQVGVNYIANDILSTFRRNFDIGTAVAGLNELRSVGGDVQTFFDTIILQAAQNKTGQVQDILARVSQLVQDGLSHEAAINQAIAEGAGKISTPEELAETTAEDIVKEGAEDFANKDATEDTETTTPPGTIPDPGTPPPVENGTDLITIENANGHQITVTRDSFNANFKDTYTEVATPQTPAPPTPTGTSLINPIPFAEGKSTTGIQQLVDSGRQFNRTDAQNYAFATGQQDFEQYIDKTGLEILGSKNNI